MTREEFEFYLKGCDVTLDNGKKFYEHHDLVKCFEDMGAFEQPEYLSKIPEDYKYDTETEDFFVYRHKYTGKEIYIEKPVPTYSFEPCEDCISRKDFIAKIEDIYDGYMLDEGGCYPQNFVDLAEEMPSVQPKQRVAKWNKVPKEYIWYCSNCKERPVMGEPFYDYCPRCGCFMKGE